MINFANSTKIAEGGLIGIPAMNGHPKTDRTLWPQAKDAALMDLVADGHTFDVCADKMNITRNAAIGRFAKLRRAMGRQAV